MAASAEFVALVEDVLRQAGPVATRRMFGGAGFFQDGLMFALVADDVLYLKVDGVSAADFDREGLAPFVYEAKGRRIALSYRRAPECLFEDRDEASRWVRLALEAARRSAPKAPVARGSKRAPVRRKAKA